MVRFAAVIAVLAGCGRLAFDPAGGDARPATDATDDAAARDCWPAWRAHAPSIMDPVLVSELATSERDGNPFLDAAGRRLYYNRGLPPRNILVTERSAPGQPFGAPIALDVSTAEDEGRLTLSDDGRIAVFPVSTAGMDSDLWLAERSDVATPFGLPSQAALININTGANESDPELSSDGLRVYLAVTPGAGLQRIHVAERTSVTGVFGPAVLVDSLPAMITADPTLSPDELVIVFSVAATVGTIKDLHYATRTTRSDPFGAAMIVPGVNDLDAAIDDSDPALSRDGCELFFKSERSGNGDLYVARVTRP